MELIIRKGQIGETYNIGGNNQIKNIDLVFKICQTLDKLKPNKKGKYEKLINFVRDRPGHDYKYCIDTTKINQKLNWIPKESIETGIYKTITWYLNNQSWLKKLKKWKK